ncbi:MAG: TIGR04438 family Trp-rich protein [Pseudomonadota bacterium]
MPFIIITVLLTALKYFEVWHFANMSWWWVTGAMALTFMWFEFLEPMLGWDKRKAHDESDKIRKQRVQEAFDSHKKNKRRR